jgi:hypothetical protein
MGVLTSESWVDLVNFTRKKYEPNVATDMMTDLQDYYALPKILKSDALKIQGQAYQWQALTDHNHSAENVGLMQPAGSANIPDISAVLTVPWRITRWYWVFDDIAVSMNAPGPEQVVDLVKTQRKAGMASAHEKMESNWWQRPPASTDEKTPWGIKYAVTANKISGLTADGFTSDNPVGSDGVAYTSKYGKDCQTFAGGRHRNWTGVYTSMTDEDGVELLRKASFECNFKSPVGIIPNNGTDGYKRGLYTTWGNWSAMNRLLRHQNDNLGTDLDAYQGVLRFQGNPVYAVPYLTQNNSYPTNPVYGIDWSCFKTIGLKGQFLREMDPKPMPFQPTTWQVWTYCVYNWACTNLRRQFVICTSAS